MGGRQGALEALDLSFWRGRRVFLTGHTGFKGSWLAIWLRSLGAEVTGYALAPATRPSLFEVAQAGSGIRSHIADIRDGEALGRALEDAQPEILFHLAAQALVGAGYAQPVETYSINVVGTAQVLDCARRVRGLRAVIGVTSDKCYHNRERPEGYREDEPLGGRDPYSSSKAGAELVLAAYRESFLTPQGVAVASARAGNAIGGGDWAPDRLVPDLLAAFAREEPARLRRPQSVRPWQHVLDPLAGYLALGRRLLLDGEKFAEAWNFGPDDDGLVNVGEVACRLAAMWGKGARSVESKVSTPHEAHLLHLDARKARERLGWRPRWNLDAALRAAVDWQRAWLSGADMRAFSLLQIERYSAAAA